jgi:uncharacterized protein (TIGR02145 family)
MKLKKVNLLRCGIILLFAVVYGSCSHAQPVAGSGQKTVKIGPKEWMVENLNVAKFRNGDVIPQAKTAEQWKKAGEAGQPAWCYYDNSDSLGMLFGKLYNWYALNDPRGLAPEGFHIPTNADWTAMTKYLTGVDVAGMKLKSVKGWKDTRSANNSSGFSALPGGMRNDAGMFAGVNNLGQWWSNSPTVRDKTQIYSLKVKDGSFEVAYEALGKGYGLSVRAVKD